MQQTRRFIAHGSVGLLMMGVSLAGCSSDEGPPPADAFPPLHFEYLTPIRLNVATIDVQNQTAPSDDDLSARSPASPEAAMERMAHDRLVAAGPSGTATFVVTEASILRGDNGLTERLSAHLDIASADGARAAFAEAHVTRSSNGDGGTGPAALYELTRAAMKDMNVEFEYQVRHSLHDWIVSGDAVEAPVEQTPLGGGGPGPLQLAPAPPAGAPGVGGGAPMQLAPPPASVPPSAEAPAAPPEMSPPPRFLAPPPGGGYAPGSGYVPPSSQAMPPAAGGY